MQLFDPELNRMVTKNEVSSEVWEELIDVDEFLSNRS